MMMIKFPFESRVILCWRWVEEKLWKNITFLHPSLNQIKRKSSFTFACIKKFFVSCLKNASTTANLIQPWKLCTSPFFSWPWRKLKINATWCDFCGFVAISVDNKHFNGILFWWWQENMTDFIKNRLKTFDTTIFDEKQFHFYVNLKNKRYTSSWHPEDYYELCCHQSIIVTYYNIFLFCIRNCWKRNLVCICFKTWDKFLAKLSL